MWEFRVFAIEESLNMLYVSFVERRGETRGEARGKALGAALVVHDLLEQRFGTLPAEIVDSLERADPERLLAWSRRVRDARSLDDVFAEDPLPRSQSED